MTTQNILGSALHLGFRPEQAPLFKSDIRGPEYGKWEIRACCTFSGATRIDVLYHPGPENGPDFGMSFSSIKDFEAWARQTT